MKDTACPLILVNGEHGAERNGTLTLARRYLTAIERAGGLPLVLPWIDDIALVDRLLDRADGVLLTGGDDFDTEALGLGPVHPRATPVPASKQNLDLALARRVLARGIPVLGICYGMQLLALSSPGARFVQDLESERPAAQEHRGGVVHTVLAEPRSKLIAALGVDKVKVVSRHHQALESPGDAWTVTGRDAEGLIEAIEHRSHPFAVGVQWHPELSPSTEHDGLFRDLVRAARRATALETTR
ncbi:MAG: gamma-glutamyl-gamma-aminobutyrate hydrolase family protein [Planctomycetota bacterium]